jgi:hypothetical protein
MISVSENLLKEWYGELPKVACSNCLSFQEDRIRLIQEALDKETKPSRKERIEDILHDEYFGSYAYLHAFGCDAKIHSEEYRINHNKQLLLQLTT